MANIFRVRQDYLDVDIRREDLNVPISALRIVVHTTGRIGLSNASDNHVTQYLLLGNERSVQINMRHTNDDLNGDLEMKSRNYTDSRKEIEHFPATFENGRLVRSFTVAEVYNAITQSHIHEFAFAGGGNGCRYWQ
ncbi:hypothetical protein LTR62_002361 [Meristemomyces frigidus]|uniref:DUF7770 domain-containing protein n=1 Tax=Meristemomyces frigidus TaxID=1508187 RepID=A0AAN7TF80_9PEZI|nr:hypothetical protein LTR62_002361 [Meristemomyces frigidus]